AADAGHVRRQLHAGDAAADGGELSPGRFSEPVAGGDLPDAGDLHRLPGGSTRSREAGCCDLRTVGGVVHAHHQGMGAERKAKTRREEMNRLTPKRWPMDSWKRLSFQLAAALVVAGGLAALEKVAGEDSNPLPEGLRLVAGDNAELRKYLET